MTKTVEINPVWRSRGIYIRGQDGYKLSEYITEKQTSQDPLFIQALRKIFKQSTRCWEFAREGGSGGSRLGGWFWLIMQRKQALTNPTLGEQEEVREQK